MKIFLAVIILGLISCINEPKPDINENYHVSNIDKTQGKTEKLLEVCQMMGADYFYEPAGGKAYFDLKVFENTGIEVEFQNYAPPVYPQLYPPFIPGLSTLDLIFNCGPESYNILMGKGSPPLPLP